MTRSLLAACAVAALLAGCAYNPGARSPEQGTAGSVVTRDSYGNPVSASADIRDEVFAPVQVTPAPPAYAVAPVAPAYTVAPSTVYYDIHGRPVAVAPGAVVAYPR